MEIESYPDIGIPLTFEPTICRAARIAIDAHTPLKGEVVLPPDKITPVIKTLYSPPQPLQVEGNIIDTHSQVPC